MQDNYSTNQITIKQMFFLVFIVPLIFILLLEVLCRILNLEQKFSPLNQAMQLEMPTWMQKDANAIQRATRASTDPAALEWLSMFEEAPGFRVRLIPNIERSVVNTFAQIQYEKSNKYFVKANSIGFRSDEINPDKDSNTYRILIFGDSSSFGWGVNQDESFSSLLPGLLNDQKHTNKIEVANFAIPGDSSEYGRLIAEHYIPKFNGDLVILGFGANDAKNSAVSHTTQVERFRTSKIIDGVQKIAQYSALFRSMRALFSKIGSNIRTNQNVKRSKRPAVAKERYLENLESMAQLAFTNGAKNVLILNLCTPGNYAKSAGKLAEKNNWLYLNGQSKLIEILPDIVEGKVETELVQQMRASYIKELNRDSLFYVTSDACHPNKLGHRVVAKEIAALITPLLQ